MNNSQEVIRLIKKLREEKQISIEELAKKVGIAKSTLSRYENEQRQFPINDLGKYASSLDVTVEYLLGLDVQKPREANIPLLGTICAGDGVLAEQNIEEYIYFPFPNKRQPDYALRVKGNSMIGVGIEEGDILYMKKAPWAEYNGQIVAAVINDYEEGVLKRMRWKEDSSLIQLCPENEEFHIIEKYPNEIKVCGVYLGHFRPEQF